MSDTNKTILRKGHVRTKGKFLNRSWKQKILVLYGPSSQGQARIVKYNNERALEEEEPSSEVFLKDVSSALRCKMSEGSHGDGITLQMMDRSIKQFLFDSEEESKAWLNAIQPEIGRTETLPDGMFRVLLLPSATLNSSGECVLHVEGDFINIYETECKSQLITKWNITHIRRYGSDSKKKQVLIEVGSKNPTGEGIYLFRTIYCEEIHNMLQQAENLMRGESQQKHSDSKGPVYENQYPNN